MRITVFKTGGNSAEGGFVSNGLTLQGPLILSGSHTEPLHAVPKQYVDNVAYNLDANNITSGTLPSARLPAFTGDATTILGSSNIVLANTGVAAGSLIKPVVNAKGLIVASEALLESDITNIGFNKITGNKPTTLVGYGITDGIRLSDDVTLLGDLLLNSDPVDATDLVTKQYLENAAGQAGGISVGDIIRKPYTTTPSGFLKCNGGEVDKTTYSNLYAVIGDTFSNDFTPGAGKPWVHQYMINTEQTGDVVGWSAATSLPGVVAYSAALVTKNKVYLIGGYNWSAAISTVYVAPIGTDGTIGAWTTTTALPYVVYGHCSFTTKNRIYIIGGTNGSSYYNAVYTAPINADGSLGSWVSAGTFPTTISWTNAIITKDRVYVVGGHNGSTAISTIYTAVVNSDGTIGTWSVHGSYPIAQHFSNITVIKNRLYVMGGMNSAARQDVYYAEIDNTGVIGAWNSGLFLPKGMSHGSVFSTKNNVVVTFNDEVYSSVINTDGSLAGWNKISTMPTVMTCSQAIITSSKVYMIGGANASTGNATILAANISGGVNDYSSFYGYENNFSNTVPGSGKPWQNQYQINTTQNTNIANWSTSTALPVTFMGNAFVTKNRVYLAGGATGAASYSNAVYTAPINADGTLGTWATAGTIPGALGGSQVIVTKNRVYLLGGNNGSAVVSTVYTAPIEADGTVGIWTTAPSLPAACQSSQAVLTQNRVYLLGGSVVGGGLTTVHTATINSDGTLGAWVSVTSLPIAVYTAQAFATKTRVYIMGGVTTAAVSSIYYAPIQLDGTLGAWVADTSLPVTLAESQVFVTKERVYLFGGFSGSTVTNASYNAPINPDGTLGTWTQGTNIPGNLSASRLIATRDHLYLIGGFTGSTYVGTVYTATINGGLNDYSPYYDGSALVDLSAPNYMMPGSGQPWKHQYQINTTQGGDITGWTAGTSLPTTLYTFATFVTKNRVYICGGYIDATTQTSNVYTAPINTDGTLGAWVTDTSLPTIISRVNAVVTKNRVYLLACTTGSYAVSTVYTAPINSDGTIGTWAAGTSLPTAISWTQPIITKNRIYICGGGADSSTALASVYTAPINSDGTLGSWTSGTSLPGLLGWSQSIVTKNRVYLLGGWNRKSDVSTVYTAPVNIDGTLGTWTTGTSLPAVNHWSHVFISKKTVYLIGGHNGSSAHNNVYYASINDDGTLGAWVTGTNLPIATNAGSVISSKDHIYLIGGNNSGGYLSTVYSATISSDIQDYSAYYDGTINVNESVTNYMMPGSGRPWQQQYQINETQSTDITGWTAGTALPAALSTGQAIVTKNRVYICGGVNGGVGVSTVYTAPINTDGTLGTWTTGTSLPGVLYYSQCILTKNRIYLLGGCNASTTYVSTVYTAPVNSDGTLGAWTTGTSLPSALGGSSAFVTKNRVYLLGGWNGSASVATVYTASINTDGTLGTWTTGTSLPGALTTAALVITKNRVYLCGGAVVSPVNTVYTAPINTDGTLGTWTTGTSLPGNLNYCSSIVTKNRAYIIGGHNGSGYVSTVYTAPINTDGTLGTWTTGTSLPGNLGLTAPIITKNNVYLLSGNNSAGGNTNTVYTATISDGLNDYSPYYDGTIQPYSLVSTKFKLPDYSSLDKEFCECLASYIKF